MNKHLEKKLYCRTNTINKIQFLKFSTIPNEPRKSKFKIQNYFMALKSWLHLDYDLDYFKLVYFKSYLRLEHRIILLFYSLLSDVGKNDFADQLRLLYPKNVFSINYAKDPHRGFVNKFIKQVQSIKKCGI